MNIRTGGLATQNFVQRTDIGLNPDIDAGDLAAIGVEEENVGLAKRAADNIDAARRAHYGVGDLWI